MKNWDIFSCFIICGLSNASSSFVGCDGFIDGSRFDSCGMCGGDNSTCRLVSGLFTKPYLDFGYNYVTDIPRNACNVTISEMNKSNNLIALRYKNGTFVLNGEWSAPNSAGVFHAAGSTFVYVKGTKGESISTNGPLCSPLELMLLYRQKNSGIKYEYRISTTAAANMLKDAAANSPPVENTISARRSYEIAEINELDLRKLEYFDGNGKYSSGIAATAAADPVEDESEYRSSINNSEETKRWWNKGRKRRFIWNVTNYTACSSSCGEGIRTPIYSCVKESNLLHVVAEKRCWGLEKPEATVQSCINAPCPAVWVIGEWSSCSVVCGEGIETRQISCQQEISRTMTIVVNDDACTTSLSANLLRTRLCFRKPCANGTAVVKPFWKTGVWGMCSTRCGIGVKTRTVHCMAEFDDECPQSDRPTDRTVCYMGPCAPRDSYVWLTTEWSPQCSETCGISTQTRKVICSVAESQQESGCDENTKPEAKKNCSRDERCSGRWFTGPWSQCSEECGWGRQTRTTICVSFDEEKKRYDVVDDGTCRDREKPSPLEQACSQKSCQGRWFMGSWSVCTRSCDSGIERREVQCLDENSKPSADCKEEDKPATRRSCNTQKCNNLYPNAKEIDFPVQGTQTETDRLSEHDNQNRNEIFHDCKDELKNCHLVARARLCNYDYYKSHCCISCYNYYYSTSVNNQIRASS